MIYRISYPQIICMLIVIYCIDGHWSDWTWRHQLDQAFLQIHSRHACIACEHPGITN